MVVLILGRTHAEAIGPRSKQQLTWHRSIIEHPSQMDLLRHRRVNVVASKGDQIQRDRDVSLGMHEAYHHNDMQVVMSLTSVTRY